MKSLLKLEEATKFIFSYVPTGRCGGVQYFSPPRAGFDRSTGWIVPAKPGVGICRSGSVWTQCHGPCAGLWSEISRRFQKHTPGLDRQEVKYRLFIYRDQKPVIFASGTKPSTGCCLFINLSWC